MDTWQLAQLCIDRHHLTQPKANRLMIGHIDCTSFLLLKMSCPKYYLKQNLRFTDVLFPSAFSNRCSEFSLDRWRITSVAVETICVLSFFISCLLHLPDSRLWGGAAITKVMPAMGLVQTSITNMPR